MLRFALLRAVAVPLAAVAAVLTLACHDASAQTTPFKIVGAGLGTEGLPLPGQDPRPHWAVGVATHLGLYYGEGTVQTDSAVPHFDDEGQLTHFTGEFGSGSPFEFTAANGDKLVTYYGRTDFGADEPGTFTLAILGVTDEGALIVQAHWVAEFVVQPDLSTGRFAGATGSWIMDAFSAPFVLGSDDPVAYAWEGTGELKLAKK